MRVQPEESVGNVESFLGEYAKYLFPMPNDMTGELRRLHWCVRSTSGTASSTQRGFGASGTLGHDSDVMSTTSGHEWPRTLPGPTLGVWGPSRADRTHMPVPSLRDAEADLRTR